MNSKASSVFVFVCTIIVSVFLADESNNFSVLLVGVYIFKFIISIHILSCFNEKTENYCRTIKINCFIDKKMNIFLYKIFIYL